MALSIDNIILNMPFDESSGSTVAYDYSANRADGVVLGADFVTGKIGNAIKFNGDEATCEVSPNILNLSGEFSLLAWINPNPIEIGSPSKVIWMLAFEGVENYVEVPIELNPGNWVSIAVTRKSTIYNFYVNTGLVQSISNGGNLIGLSLNQDYYGGQYGQAMIDDMKAFNVALTQTEINDQMNNVKQLIYSIDGVNLKDYGVYVSDSEGLLDRPRMKAPMSLSWDNYHGESVDLNHKFYESREISLSCFIKATGKGDFATKLNNFLRIFDKKGTHRFMVDIHPTKPLLYEVFSESAISIKKTWNDSLMIGTFTLILKEPSPVKRVLKHIRVGDATKTCSITMTTVKRVDIYWGDGSVTTDFSGNLVNITHEYDNNGEYYIIVAGCVDEIKLFTTNAIIVFDKI
jgi:hypothetical protein